MSTGIEKTERLAVPIWPDAAKMIGIGRATAYEAAKTGEIPTVKIGGRKLVPLAKLRELFGIAA